MMRDGTRMWRVWAAVCALVCCAAPALAQVPANVVIVGANVTTDPDIFTDDLQDGIQEAIRRSRSGTGRVLVLVQDDASPYDAISIPADADLLIFGIHVGVDPDLRNASTNVVQGIAGDAAITIHTESDPNFLMGDDNETPFEDGPSDVLVIHGLAATGGNNGVLIDATGASDTVSVLLDAMYIHNNSGTLAGEGNGIRTEGAAIPVLTNNSIWGNGDRNAGGDEGAGVSIGVGGNLFALHNTILLNENYGVHFEDGTTATIRNTIVYRNGDESEQSAIPGEKDGGLVWDVDPFIDPNFGPVAGGTAVSMTGDFVGTSGVTTFNVYFGPPDMAVAIPVTDAGGVLNVTSPAAYRGVPGPVDIYIVRTDGYQVHVPMAFTYVNDAGDAPLVSQVVPEWGDVAGGNFVFVLGAGFEPDCDVFFGAEMSDEVTFLSSGELIAKVPDVAAAAKVEVFVRNNRTGITSALTDPRDYEYRDTGSVRPSIVQITPNYFRDTEGDESDGVTPPRVTSNILVWNLEPQTPSTPDPVVKIGGLVVPYASVALVDGPFTPQPNLGSDGGYLYEIIDVEIPVSEFGGGGSYDVTVINPSGLSDTLNAGFTYYADGIPRPDPSDREWLPANFAPLSGSNPRTLQGSAYDTDILLTLNPLGVPIVLGPFNPTDGAALPPYVSHSQREVNFSWPGDPTTLTLPLGAQTVVVQIDNAADAQGDPSVGATVQTTDFHYLVTPFDIQNISVAVGAPDTITADITNLTALGGVAAFTIFVDDVDVGVITDNGGDNVTFTVPTAEPGIYGPVDIRVETTANPVGTDPLYYIAEDAYSYRRTDPQAYGVFPRTIAEDTTLQPSPVRVTGTDFIGPFSTTTPYTRVFLDDGDGVPEPGTEDLDISADFGIYDIASFMELQFTIDIVTAETNQGVTIPRNTPIAIHLDNFDPVTATVIGGPTTLTDAVIISAADPPPEITEVQLFSDGSRRDGPVRGGSTVRILGFNFDTLVPSGLDPLVRIGGEQAEIVSFTDNADPTPDEILIVTPPAPDLLPGTYSVVVIRPADQQQGISPPDKDFTYFLDGAPEILEIVPNHISFPAAGDTDPRYITIKGLNFTDIVQVEFLGAIPQTIDHYSVSPTEIVVKVPLGADAQSVLLVSPGGSVSIPVLVRNVPSDGTAVTATTNESNTVPIIIFDDDSGIEPDVATLEFNNVYENSNDYVMVQPGTGSISIDPMFDPRDAAAAPGLPGPKLFDDGQDPWVGKLAIRDPNDGIVGDNTEFENPMRNKAGEFTLTPFTDLDFELQPRPDFESDPLEVQGTGPASGLFLPDIGADEISTILVAAADDIGWYLARPVPNPVPALDAGDLSILVGFRPEGFIMDPFDLVANSGGGTVNDVSFFIVPQGGDPTADADKIPLSVSVDLGGGLYLLSNANDAIETLLDDRDATNDPSAGDLLADGHAAIYVRPNPNEPLFILGDHPTDLSDGNGGVNPNGTVIISGTTYGPPLDNAIYAQAVLGRHFLIDTVPPRANLASATYVGTEEAIESHEVVLDFNDAFDLTPLAAPTHPTIPTGMTPDFLPWYSAFVFAPLDTNQTLGGPTPPSTPATDFGVRLPSTTGPASTSIFFNPFSLSNLTGGLNLQFRVAIEFFDPPLVDSGGIPITGIDFYTGTDDPRQASGFDPSYSTSEVVGDDNVLLGPVRWDVIRGAALLLDTVTTPVQISNDFATSGTNLGVFDLSQDPEVAMSNPPNNATDSDNGAVVASWGGPSDATVDPMVFSDSVEHLDAAARGAFNLSVQFDGEDLAGNDSTDDPDNTLLNPLNIYWYRDVNSRIDGITDNALNPTSNPIATFSLIRDGDPSPATDGGPTPIYSYRLWTSLDFTTYTPFTPWLPWSPDRTITTLSQTLLTVPDRGILLVVHGADEAGNVEPWDDIYHGFAPDDVLDMDAPLVSSVPGETWATLDEYATGQPNWVRFFFSGTQPPNTRVRANFWHDDKTNNVLGFINPTVLAAGVDTNLGNTTIVPMPGREATTGRRVAAQFFLSVDVPPEFDPLNDTVELAWELFRDGVLVLDSKGFFLNDLDGAFCQAHSSSGLADAEGFYTIGPAETTEVIIPELNQCIGLGDPNLQEDITYVFRATSRIMRTGLPAGVDTLTDSSPASVLFTVVPLDTQTFVAQALDPDRQPIVIMEEE